jgi:alpha-beta hydrolase superfamily lysophospholipase
MIHKDYTWKSKDGITLYGQSWMPENSPRTVIQYVHGFKDHSGRFERWAVRLSEHGYGVIAVDLRGHGRSEGRRGYAKNFNSYIDDVAILSEKSRELYPHAVHVLYGHSLGGNIVANYLISEKLLPDAAVISSPWFELALRPSLFKMVLAQIARRILPYSLFQSDLDVNAISRDKKVIREYNADPLVHNSISPKIFFEIEQQGAKASKTIYKINIPLLVMHGTGDLITSHRASRNFVRNASGRTTYTEWPGSFHELHNDINEKEVFASLLNWLAMHNR